MKRNTEKNREKLAKGALDQMDFDAMEEYIADQFEEYYKTLSQKEFNEEWEQAFGES
jgi:hypothetical protein